MNVRISTLVTLLTLFSSALIFAQGSRKKAYPARTAKPRPTQDQLFLQTQWWLGFKAGANTSMANPETRFSGFSPINYAPGTIEKEYGEFDSWAGHAGLEITFYHQGFSFSFQPNYRRQRFAYTNNFQWAADTMSTPGLTLQYKQDHKLDYIELPIMIKYDLTKGAFRPFIFAGGYYAILVGANKHVELTGTDAASGVVGPFETQDFIIGAEDLFIKSSAGVLGGVGFSYDFWNIRLSLDAAYRYGLNNITDVKNRYSNTELTGMGDAPDDITIDNISISLSCLFPLRFINKNYSATN